jgi:uncharacterized protein (TIGR03083 family)
VDTAAHIAAIEQDGLILAEAAERAGLAAPVPSCPAWQVRDLVRHLSYVHRWAAAYITQQIGHRTERPSEAELLAGGPPDAELLAWFRDGHAGLTAALASADPELACWTFLPAPTPLAFWARRQAHETAIHRADAQLAAGEGPVFAAELAADGIDELLLGFYGPPGSGSGTADETQTADDGGDAAARTLRLRPTDTGDQWYARLSADGRSAERTGRGPGPAGQAGCELAGPASSLYRLMWNRAGTGLAGITITGSEKLLRDWAAGMTIYWG